MLRWCAAVMLVIGAGCAFADSPMTWTRAAAQSEPALPQTHAAAQRPQSVRISALRVASWNLEWLADPATLNAADFWDICRARGWPNEILKPGLPYCDVYRRYDIVSASDYQERKLAPLRQGLAALAAGGLDILAVEEVQSPSALAAVLPAGYRVLCFTKRVDA